MDWSQAFDQTLHDYGVSAKWLARESGISEVAISRFRRGKQAITTDTLNALLKPLSIEARDYFFSKLLGSEVTPADPEIEILIEKMEVSQLANLLNLIASRMRQSRQITDYKGEPSLL